MRSLVSLAILFLAMACLCQCAHLVQTHQDYALTGEETEVNGARLGAELLTTDGLVNYSLSAMVYFVAGETETGPYKCLLTAWGDRSVHQSMTVQSLRFQTAGGQTATAPPSGPLAFAPGLGDAGWQATYVIPGVLDLDYKKDGDVTIDATVSIRARGRRGQKKDVRLVLAPLESRAVRFATVFDGFRKGEKESSLRSAETQP